MIFNIIVGFIIPWISGIVFYFTDRKVLFTIAPFQSVVAFTVNSFGFFYKFGAYILMNIVSLLVFPTI